MYEVRAEENLLVVMHTGYDIAFPRLLRADPEKLLRIHRALPQLKLVTTHLGAWQQWDQVEATLVGHPVAMEISFALDSLPGQQARRILLNHGAEYLLFGTDSPWTDQGHTLQLLRSLDLPQDRLDKILWANAARLLGLQ
jgi:predicted TIM-barrel fold metal-dependent hydrolase